MKKKCATFFYYSFEDQCFSLQYVLGHLNIINIIRFRQNDNYFVKTELSLALCSDKMIIIIILRHNDNFYRVQTMTRSAKS